MVAKWLRHRVIVKLDRSSGVMGSRWWLMVSDRVIEHHFDDRRSAGLRICGWLFWGFFFELWRYLWMARVGAFVANSGFLAMACWALEIGDRSSCSVAFLFGLARAL